MIYYFSQTGNTKLLADTLKEVVKDSKIIYVGFWTDKGNANQEAFSLEQLVLEKVKNTLNALSIKLKKVLILRMKL